MKKNLHLALASGFGSGFVPKAQGTIASLVYIVPFVFFIKLGLNDLSSQVTILIFLSVLGFISTRYCLQNNLHQKYGRKKISLHETLDDDPSFVVIDEWAGMQFALLESDDFLTRQIVCFQLVIIQTVSLVP